MANAERIEADEVSPGTRFSVSQNDWQGKEGWSIKRTRTTGVFSKHMFMAKPT